MHKFFRRLFAKRVKCDKGNIVNIPKHKNIKVKIKGTGNIVTVGDNITNDSKIRINIMGNNNKVNIGSSNLQNNIKLMIGFRGNIVNDATFQFGKNNHTQMTGYLLEEDGTSIIIGDNNLFSWNIEVRCSDSHTILDSDGNVINKAESITIGNGVWIGHDCTILKNTNIPDGCVIGTHTIVTKKFTEPNCLLVGIPAKIVKTNISWNHAHPNTWCKKQGV